MLYSIQFTFLDMVWVFATLVAVVTFAGLVRFGWIRSGVLMAFLVVKMGLGLSFTSWTVFSDVESDACGYFSAGSAYAEMFKDLVTGVSIDYVNNTPFWWFDGSPTDRFTSLTGLILTLTGGSFLGATAIACLFGATGQLLLYRFFRERFSEVRAIYFLPVLFHPSLMLWSGMLLKDSFGLFALGVAVYTLHRLIGARQLFAIAPLGISLYIIFLFRSFIFFPFVAFALFMVWDRVVSPYAERRNNGGIVKGLYLMASGTACIFVLWVLVRNFGGSLIEDRRDTAVIFSQIEAGSSFENVELSFSPRGLLALGAGVINSLFRPFPWDVAKPIQAAAAVENLVVLGFVWIGFKCYLQRLTSRQRGQFAGLFWGMLVVALIVGTGVGLFASNSGTISRYRIPMIPFLVAVPGLALGMEDSFRRMGQRFRPSGFRQRFEMPRKKPRLA